MTSDPPERLRLLDPNKNSTTCSHVAQKNIQIEGFGTRNSARQAKIDGALTLKLEIIKKHCVFQHSNSKSLKSIVFSSI